MPATPPPESLRGFPHRDLLAGHQLFRIVRGRDPETGVARSSWYFSSVTGPPTGRFDLPPPEGTCYASDQRWGAWLEVFRGCGLVDRADVEARRLVTLTRTGAAVTVADLRAKGARAFGVTGDLASGSDYELPQIWARSLRAAGFDGVSAGLRHDPSATALTLGLFGRGGPQKRVLGWGTRTSALVGDLELLAGLAPFGTGVASRPYDVPVMPVP